MMHYIVHCEDVRRKTNVVLTRTKYNNIDLTEIFGSLALVTKTSVEDRRRYDHLCRWVSCLLADIYHKSHLLCYRKPRLWQDPAPQVPGC